MCVCTSVYVRVRAHARKGERRVDLRQVRVSFVQGDMKENTTLVCFAWKIMEWKSGADGGSEIYLRHHEAGKKPIMSMIYVLG